jgi:hypothetical protein
MKQSDMQRAYERHAPRNCVAMPVRRQVRIGTLKKLKAKLSAARLKLASLSGGARLGPPKNDQLRDSCGVRSFRMRICAWKIVAESGVRCSDWEQGRHVREILALQCGSTASIRPSLVTMKC